MNTSEFLHHLADGHDSFSDLMDALREEYPGRGEASHHIASTAGVSLRTAQKWLKGVQTPGKATAASTGFGKLAAEARRLITARMIAEIQAVDAIAEVVYVGPPLRDEGERHIGYQDGLNAGMSRVAGLWADGDEAAAAEGFDRTILASYFGEDPDYWEGESTALDVTEYSQLEVY